MPYIFDKYSLKYMLEQFPRKLMNDMWKSFEANCYDETIISERETQKNLERELVDLDNLEWLKTNNHLFKPINENEAKILGDMMATGDLDFFDTPQLAERRLPEGIPFILCIAKNQKRSYVYRKNTVFLPSIINICQKYRIEHIEVEEYLIKTKTDNALKTKG